MSEKYFSNLDCPYFPCHRDVPIDRFNCLFCFCPLYPYNCGGKYKILPDGTKDCSNCIIPHTRQGYDYIIGKLEELRSTEE